METVVLTVDTIAIAALAVVVAVLSAAFYPHHRDRRELRARQTPCETPAPEKADLPEEPVE